MNHIFTHLSHLWHCPDGLLSECIRLRQEAGLCRAENDVLDGLVVDLQLMPDADDDVLAQWASRYTTADWEPPMV